MNASSSANVGHDIIRDSLVNAVGSVVQALEPQINEFSAKMASQAVHRSKDIVNAGYAKVQKQPWYLVGIAAFLLVGAAVMIGFGESETSESKPNFNH